jgi:hypothetical protein
MFPCNAPPKTLPDLMNKFRHAPRIHEFVKAQLAAGARFAKIMLQICYPKLDMTKICWKVSSQTDKEEEEYRKNQ